MADIKISELEPTTDLEGLYTIGSDKNNLSKKVSLQFLKDAANYANEQGDYAKQAGDTVNGNVGVSDYPEFSASKSYVIGDIVRYNGVLYSFTANHAASAWNGSDVKATSINAITSGKLTELESEVNIKIRRKGTSWLSWSDWEVGDYFYNTNNNQLSRCIKAPVTTGSDIEAVEWSKTTIYRLDDYLYQWDGTSLKALKYSGKYPVIYTRAKLVADNINKTFRLKSDLIQNVLELAFDINGEIAVVRIDSLSDGVPYTYGESATKALIINNDYSGLEVVDYKDSIGSNILAVFLYDAANYKDGGIVTTIIHSVIPSEIHAESIVKHNLSEIPSAAIDREKMQIVSNESWKVVFCPVISGRNYTIKSYWDNPTPQYEVVGFCKNTPTLGIQLDANVKIIDYDSLSYGNLHKLTYTPWEDGYIVIQVYNAVDNQCEVTSVDLRNKMPNNSFTKVRFANWNIAHFNLADGITNVINTDAKYREYLPIYRKCFSKMGADFISLCEFEKFFQSGTNSRRVSNELLPQYPYYEDDATRTSNGCWVAYFSKLPIYNITEVPFKNYPTDAYRYYLVGDMYLDGKTIKVVCTHLTHDEEHKYAPLQMQQLIDDFKNDAHVVIMADWNSGANDMLPLKGAGYSLANCDYDGILRTYWDRSNVYDGAMDNIAVKGGVISNVEVVNCNNITGIEKTLSDHFLIGCDVVFVA